MNTRSPERLPSPLPLHRGLYEVHLPVTDVDRAIAFYVDKLGFALGWREHESNALLVYDDGGTRWMLGLFRVEAIEGWYHVSFRVDEGNAEGMVAALRARGIEAVHPPRAPVQGPMDEPIVHGWMPAAAAFFRDPDGHLLELIADLSDPPRPEFRYRPLSEWRALTRGTSSTP
jgi:catechol 2,3-dioxygenase-like lactoylglutathione lyase family enzyme